MAVIKQFSKYGGAALGSAITDYAVFSVLFFYGLGAVPSQMVARISGGIFSFVTNKYWSFEAKKLSSVKTEGRRFLILYLFSYALALGIFYALNELAGMPAYPAKIIADISCFVVNFVVMRSYVFGGGQGLSSAFTRSR